MRALLVPLILVPLLLPPRTARAETNVPPPGFVPLFNGRDLSGWYGWGTRNPEELRKMTPEERAEYKRKSLDGGLVDAKGVDQGDHVRAHWRVEDGELVNDGKGLYLTTDRDYGDFELLVDFKTEPKGDSGVYLRGIPQVQIWDPANEAQFKHGCDKGSGGLWNNKGVAGKFPLRRMDRPCGEWNTFGIRMIGERVTVILNGVVVVDDAPLENFFAGRNVAGGEIPDPPFPSGPIQLQTHGSPIRWRNVFVREIPPDEADRVLGARDAEGFVELVNGRDLSGWQGAVDHYEIIDGAVVCRPGKGGALLSREEFGDCVIRTEFRLPPAGNNGIALRMPATGNPADAGLEIQVLDSDGYNARSAAKGGKPLEPYQYHGSIYHCVPAKHGFLRPSGAWNFQEVVVRGQRITVTLNGTRILDADLDTLDRSRIPHPPQGLDRRRGFVGLAGHSDPVAFRSFRVKRL